MKSVRLGADLEAKLKAAAQAAGESESEFMRGAVAERADTVLGDALSSRMVGIIGAVTSEGGRAADAHRRYGDLLRRDSRRASKSRR